jgi:hypothetical protein
MPVLTPQLLLRVVQFMRTPLEQLWRQGKQEVLLLHRQIPLVLLGSTTMVRSMMKITAIP